MPKIDWRDTISIAGAVGISVLVIVSFACVCIALFFLVIPEEMENLAMLLLGILGAGFTTVINYWTGSTSSSQKKDVTIAEQATTAAATIAETATVAAATAATVAATSAAKEK